MLLGFLFALAAGLPAMAQSCPASRILGAVTIIVGDDMEAAIAKREILAAEKISIRMFDAPLPSGTLVSTELAACRPRTTDATAGWVLDWTFYPERDPSKSYWIDDEGSRQFKYSTAIRHEISHYVLDSVLDARLAGRAPPGPHHAKQYGSFAPDWFDEMVALAFEDDTRMADRRRDMAERVRQGKIIPLPILFAAIHPEFVAPQPDHVPAASSGSEASPKIETIAFYAQLWALQAFADQRGFLVPMLRGAADALAAGDTFESWLSRQCSAIGMPCTVMALDEAFQAWLIDAFEDARHAPGD